MIQKQIQKQKQKQFQSNELLYSLKMNYCDSNFASSPPNTFLETLEKRITSYKIKNQILPTNISEKI